MLAGGRITIETAIRWLDAQAARTLNMVERQYISLPVTDTDSGMTPEVMAGALEPLWQSRPCS